MDLSGHKRFLDRAAPLESDVDAPPDTALATGPALLFSAWSALGSGGIEAVDLHLRTGLVIRGAVRVRLMGPLAQASTRREGWTHVFPADDLILVRLVARGGHRG
ncbi:hypothetical protein [Thermaurantiacus sp.]